MTVAAQLDSTVTPNRHRPTTWLVAGLVVAIVLVLAVVVRRDGCDCGGPLSSELTDIEERPGSALDHLEALAPGERTQVATVPVINTAASPARITAVRAEGGLAVTLLGQAEGPATGAPVTVPPGDGLPLGLEVAVPPGTARGSILAFDGLTVEYEIDGRRYVDELPVLATTICVERTTCDRNDPEVAAAQAAALRAAGG